MGSETARRPSVPLFLSLGMLLAACGAGPGPASGSSTGEQRRSSLSAGDLLEEDGRFAIMVELLGGFVDRMRDPTWNGSLFAPPDDVFEALPPGTLARLRADENLAERTIVIRNHILPFALRRDGFATRDLTTAHGQRNLKMIVRDGDVTVDGAAILETITASNGVLHVVSAVIGIDG